MEFLKALYNKIILRKYKRNKSHKLVFFKKKINILLFIKNIYKVLFINNIEQYYFNINYIFGFILLKNYFNYS